MANGFGLHLAMKSCMIIALCLQHRTQFHEQCDIIVAGDERAIEQKFLFSERKRTDITLEIGSNIEMNIFILYTGRICEQRNLN